jgi:hypothetical protein
VSSNSSGIAGAASNNSSRIAGADAKAGVTIGDSAQNGTAAKAGAPIRAINGSRANASSAEAPTSNGTAVPFISQIGSAVSAATHNNGDADAPPRRGDPSKKRTAQYSATSSNQKQSTGRHQVVAAATVRPVDLASTATRTENEAGIDHHELIWQGSEGNLQAKEPIPSES